MKTASTIIILSAYLWGYEYDRNENRLDYNHPPGVEENDYPPGG